MCDGQYTQNCQVRVTDYRAVVQGGPEGDLTLKATSPALNVGATLTDVPTDRLGVPRPYGSGYDIGAYEYTTAAPPIDPPPIEPPSGADTTKPQATLTAPLAGHNSQPRPYWRLQRLTTSGLRDSSFSWTARAWGQRSPPRPTSTGGIRRAPPQGRIR